jgi:hypothetical protein
MLRKYKNSFLSQNELQRLPNDMFFRFGKYVLAGAGTYP